MAEVATATVGNQHQKATGEILTHAEGCAHSKNGSNTL
jgi:hypothetical protein